MIPRATAHDRTRRLWLAVALVAGLAAAGPLPAEQAPTKPQAAKPAAKKEPAAKPQAAKPAAKKEPAAKPQAAKPAAKLQKRDPFKNLLAKGGEGGEGGPERPPGKRGLVIAELVVNGIVATPTENIAVVSMPGRNRAYFLRQRDELFNGYVERITGDGVVFKEQSTDAFGRVFEKEVVKEISGGVAVTRPGARR